MRRIKTLLLLTAVLSTPAAAQHLTIATYNIYFLDAGISAERRENLNRVITELDADVIAFQEISNPAALRRILPENYQIAMLDDPQEVQELALAVRTPLRILSTRYAWPQDSLDRAFPRSRDLLHVTVEARGRKLDFLVHHAKSRRGGRTFTDPRREMAAELIVEYIRRNLQNAHVILLGDFNDNPDDKSVNILEYGRSDVPGGIDIEEDSFLFNTTESLLDDNICSHGYSYLYRDLQSETFDPSVPGSSRENNRWRGRKYDYRRDVRVKAILLDQILVSLNLKKAVRDVGVFNRTIAVRGIPSRIRFIEGQLVYTRRGTLPSDHVPVWIRLDPQAIETP